MKRKKKKIKLFQNKPLAEQLWLFVAKQNFLESTKLESFMATTGFGLAKRMVVIRRRIDGKAIKVQVRQLFGYVSLITGDGIIHRIKIDTTDKDKVPEFDDCRRYFWICIS